MKLFITGLKHCGKSTASRLIASHLGLERADSDDLVLEATGAQSIREYYRTEGKEAFMERELEAVEAYASSHRAFVMSLGGGASDNSALMDLIRREGTVIYISRPEEVLIERILMKGIPPFLDQNDPRGSFHSLYLMRDSVYRVCADLVVSLGGYGDKEETAKLIERKLTDFLGPAQKC